jgi:hypothetical protein
MKRMNRPVAAALFVALMPLAGCQKQQVKEEKTLPATVEKIDGSKLKKVTLTESAMKRLDVQLSEVIEQKGPRHNSPQLAVPYGALIYEPDGTEWVYTSPEPRVFVRSKVKVDYVAGDVDLSFESFNRARTMVAFLKEGPEIGTKVVSVATLEIYGEEKGNK